MKRNLLVVSFIVLLFNLGFSQSKIRLGIEGGPNYSSYRGFYGSGNFDPRISFTAGITSEFRLNHQLYLKTGLSFERKRATNGAYYYNLNPNSPFDPGIRIAAYIQADYVVCPVMAKYEFTKNDSFYMAFGGFMAFTLKSDFFTDDNYNSSNVFKSPDIGLCIGVGKSFDFGLHNKIYIEIRDNLGVVNINKSYHFNNGKVNTNSFNLICGYSFDFK